FMGNQNNKDCGALTGTILGYDIAKDKPTGKYDSTGVFRKWYGHWYDRGQGKDCHPQKYAKKEYIPAICGALFFCRKEALDSVLIRDKEIFDNTFFMYKEDIDLSLRLRNEGWKLAFVPHLVAYHCRGWYKERKRVPRILRMCSARNELFIHKRSREPIPL